MPLRISNDRCVHVLQLLPYVAWPGAFVVPRDGCADLDDPSAVRAGWWFESSAVWAAVKHGDKATLIKLLDSIAK